MESFVKQLCERFQFKSALVMLGFFHINSTIRRKMAQLHKQFTDDQVKMPLHGYCQGLLSRDEIQEMLSISTHGSLKTRRV